MVFWINHRIKKQTHNNTYHITSHHAITLYFIYWQSRSNKQIYCHSHTSCQSCIAKTTPYTVPAYGRKPVHPCKKKCVHTLLFTTWVGKFSDGSYDSSLSLSLFRNSLLIAVPPTILLLPTDLFFLRQVLPQVSVANCLSKPCPLKHDSVMTGISGHGNKILPCDGYDGRLMNLLINHQPFYCH